MRAGITHGAGRLSRSGTQARYRRTSRRLPAFFWRPVDDRSRATGAGVRTRLFAVSLRDRLPTSSHDATRSRGKGMWTTTSPPHMQAKAPPLVSNVAGKCSRSLPGYSRMECRLPQQAHAYRSRKYSRNLSDEAHRSCLLNMTRLHTRRPAPVPTPAANCLRGRLHQGATLCIIITVTFLSTKLNELMG